MNAGTHGLQTTNPDWIEEYGTSFLRYPYLRAMRDLLEMRCEGVDTASGCAEVDSLSMPDA